MTLGPGIQNDKCAINSIHNEISHFPFIESKLKHRILVLLGNSLAGWFRDDPSRPFEAAAARPHIQTESGWTWKLATL